MATYRVGLTPPALPLAKPYTEAKGLPLSCLCHKMPLIVPTRWGVECLEGPLPPTVVVTLLVMVMMTRILSPIQMTLVTMVRTLGLLCRLINKAQE